jgi:hypothetical protein
MSVPFTRTLPYVLREQLQGEREGVALLVARIVSAPDNAHVTIELGGTNITIPRLASFTAPPAGGSAYVLASKLVMIAIGTVET